MGGCKADRSQPACTRSNTLDLQLDGFGFAAGWMDDGEESKGEEELTWQGRTPLRQAFHPGRCQPTTKPLVIELNNLVFGSPLTEQSWEDESQ